MPLLMLLLISFAWCASGWSIRKLINPPRKQTQTTDPVYFPIDGGAASMLKPNQKKSGEYYMPMTDANLRFYYNDMITRVYESETVRLGLRLMIEKIAVIAQFYHTANAKKQQELFASLQANLLSPFVYKIYLLQEDDSLSDLLIRNLAIPKHGKKLQIVSIGSRLTMKAAFDFANDHIVPEMKMKGLTLLVAVINIDNLLTSPSVANMHVLLTRPEFAKTIFFISRTSSFFPTIADYANISSQNGNDRSQCTAFFGSADVFVFRPPFHYNDTAADFAFSLGMFQIEEIFAKQILTHMKDWRIFNPCLFVESFHNHRLRQATGTGMAVAASQPVDWSTTDHFRPALRLSPTAEKYKNVRS